MAEAALKQAHLVNWQVWIGGFEMALLVAALAFSIYATVLTVTTSRRQLRAYVFLEEARVMGINRKVAIFRKIKNYGQTPAHQCVDSAMAIAVMAFPLPKELPELGEDTATDFGTLPPSDHHEAIAEFRELTNAEREGLMKGTLAMYAYGIIHYTDVFNRRWHSRYCVYIGGPLGISEHMATYEKGNDAT